MIDEQQAEEAQQRVEQLLRYPESLRFECKRVCGKVVRKALEAICAMANTSGGMLILGLEDPDKATGQDRLFGIEERPENVDELRRKVQSHLQPEVEDLRFVRMECTLRDGRAGHILGVEVPPSKKVHSIAGNGTWLRLDKSNREMSAEEITELMYRRGVRSAESEAVDVPFELLDTDAWRQFIQARGMRPGNAAEQLARLGLAKQKDNSWQTVRAAVLLFADEPGGLLAAHQTRADIRIFHYKGNKIEPGAVPNLVKQPRTISGPLYRQIADTSTYVLEELASGLTLAASGFKTMHRYPERVIKEAITNAVIHRDYRINRDIQIRIFDNRIEVSSPGALPARITPANIDRAGSFARNPLIARCLRDFPEPPNVDAGEGVRMMFAEMRAANLYPPQYRESKESAIHGVQVTLINAERPPIWDQVSDWIDRNGPISNSNLCTIAEIDTLRASRRLRRWVEQGLLERDDTKGKRNTIYRKSASESADTTDDSLSAPENNEPTS